MSSNVVCLRPLADFTRVGVEPPANLSITYCGPEEPSLPALLEEASALVIPAVGPKLPGTLFGNAPLRLVQITGAGVDRLDRAALEAAGVPVANVPGGSNSALAEYAVTCASTLLRRFAWSNAEIRRGNYGAFRARLLSDNVGGLDGLLVGVVGLGTIGLAVAEAFQKAGCRLAYFDPDPRDPAAAERLGAIRLPLDELLVQSDVVTLHVPLIEATRNLIGAEQFALMKPQAVLVNAARGGIVDEAALAAALTEATIAGAAVDVYSQEPPTGDNPLLSLSGEAADRLLLTPHIAGVTRQSAAFLFRSAWDNVGRVVAGEAPLNRVY